MHTQVAWRRRALSSRAPADARCTGPPPPAASVGGADASPMALASTYLPSTSGPAGATFSLPAAAAAAARAAAASPTAASARERSAAAAASASAQRASAAAAAATAACGHQQRVSTA